MNRMMRALVSLGVLILLAVGSSVMAQEATPQAPIEKLLLSTSYPSQVIGIGETLTLGLNLHTDTAPQIVDLSFKDLPADWTASFRGGGRIVDSVFVQPSKESTVDLRIEPPAGVPAGTYPFTVIAKGDGTESELPVALTVEEKAPASLAFDVDLPSVRGKPNTTFTYNVTLKNDGDVDLTVDLSADAPAFFNVVFKSSSQEVTNVPVKAKSSERLSVSATAVNTTIPADNYPITLHAAGGDVTADLQLVAEVVGQSDLSLATADGRLSGDAQVGEDTALSLILQNSGSAASKGIKLTASQPSGWTVDFTPAEIPQIDPGQQVEVTAKLRPADKALAGDYMVTLRAQPDGESSQTADYRVTVRTSTLWGIAGIGLIAIAVGVVGFAVSRFGRR